MTASRPLPSAPVRPVRVQAFVLRSPIETPVQTSFGIMYDRPALFVRVEDADGTQGWGEVWCNFPSCGAEHRARLVDTVLAPLLTAQAFADPKQAFDHLTQRTAVLALQSGEPGPFAQCIAGLDLALWDLCARRAGLPLWRYLGGSSDEVEVYASGLNPTAPERVVEQRRSEGYRAFKLKIGFGEDRDIGNLTTLRHLLGPEAPLMADVNQAWDPEQAQRMAPLLARFGLGWLEEPLRCDRPWSEWQQLAAACSVPLAAGENVMGPESFALAVASGALRVLQPDLAKWGGISGCWPVVEWARAAGLRYCPHYLGGGIGLLASAHVLAAHGGEGMLEVDANPNPLRTELAPVFSAPVEGRCRLGDAPGIGRLPDVEALARSLAR